MKLDQPSQAELEEFFGESLSDTGLRLSQINFHAGGVAQVFVHIIGASGITLGRHVFLLSRLEKKGRSVSAALAVHEICHVLQYERKGVVRFLLAYLAGYFQRLHRQGKWGAKARQEAYATLPEELDAQNAENAFLQWRLNRRHELPLDWPRSGFSSSRSRPAIVALD